MKTTSAKNILLMVVLVFGQQGHSQDFVNLDFESADVLTYSHGSFIPTINAFPNWTAYYGSSTNSTSLSTSIVAYDSVSLGGALVILEDASAPSGGGPLPLEGGYSVLLQGSIPSAATSASIGQIGTIPSTAQSLTFLGNLGGNLQVTFNGQNIPYSATGNEANYTIYAANIASYAGQTGQLLFTTPTLTSALLDNIQFSPNAVPEPSALVLSALGTLLFGYCRWRKIA